MLNAIMEEKYNEAMTSETIYGSSEYGQPTYDDARSDLDSLPTRCPSIRLQDMKDTDT